MEFIIGAGFLGFGLIVLMMILQQFIIVGRPDQLIVLSGRQRQLTDGSSVGYRLLQSGGWTFRVPLLEQVEWMDLRNIPIDIRVSDAYSKGGISLNVHAIANVKVADNPGLTSNAIERFLGRDPREIKQVAKETLEGHLRGVLATLTPEEVNEDRLKFAGALVDESEEDFEKLGLALDTLKIQAVSDEVNYLESIGRARIAEVIRDAEIAESNAKAEAEQVEAESRQVGEVAVQHSQTSIIESRNALRQLTAELEANARSAEEEAQAAAQQARAAAEAELQEVRKQLEQLRLMADVVLPAQAQQQAQALAARGDAATIEENGRAMAAVLQMLTETWLKAGSDARDIFLIQQLEDVLKTVIERVNKMELTEVTLIDGGDGQTLPRHVASFPATVRSVLDELRNSTGVDVTGILAGAVRPEEK